MWTIYFALDTGAEYFLGDALGSVRQLVNEAGEVSLVQSYQPYGSVLGSAGDGLTSYGFTGEWMDDYNELLYLRSRIYSFKIGRFLTKDPWDGDFVRPMSYDVWLYGYANPIRYVDPAGQSSEIDPYDLLYGIRVTGNWSSENKDLVRAAVVSVAQKFARTLGVSMTGLPSNNPQALIFMAVFGIYKGDTLNFKWDPQCSNCRPKPCIDANLWENQDPDTCDCGKTGTCYCLPMGGYTHSSRWIDFASMWSSGYDNYEERRIHNVIHELGHAFDNRISGSPANIVETSPPPIKGDSWKLKEKPKGFFNASNGNMTWMQSTVASGSETFADMFLGWVFNKWEPGDYGDTRAEFMDEHMGSWIRQAMFRP